MAKTKVQICNLALSRVADEGAQITSLDGSSREVRLCNLYYEPALNETIRRHPWNCAIKRVQLSQLTEEPVFGYKYKYQLPVDFVRTLEVTSTESTQYEDRYRQFDWRVEGLTILTNEEKLFLKYVKYIEDPNEMDALFMRCFYTALAEKLAIPLTEDEALKNSITGEIESVILPEARSVNAQEGYEHPVVESDLLDSRYSYGAHYAPFAQSDYGTIG